ncbi:MAG: FecR domain-containing protein, partial [Undibacterium sp.]|nr:FecR domain-containing protein [Opitutaceae bacterium]
MNDPLDHADPIEEAAADWLTLRAEGFSSAQKRDFERWCRADSRHAAALTRLEAACTLLEKMPLVRAELQPVVAFPAEARSARPPATLGSRRVFTPLRVALGLAAAVALAFLGARQFTAPPPASAQSFATSAGGYERVVLADGSVLELNGDTRLRVSLAPHERRVELVAGEAHFTVAHDRTRPFIVSAGGVAVRAVGTAFNVRLATTAVEVLVTEGK